MQDIAPETGEKGVMALEVELDRNCPGAYNQTEGVKRMASPLSGFSDKLKGIWWRNSHLSGIIERNSASVQESGPEKEGFGGNDTGM